MQPGRGPHWDADVAGVLERIDNCLCRHHDHESAELASPLDARLDDATIRELEHQLYKV